MSVAASGKQKLLDPYITVVSMSFSMLFSMWLSIMKSLSPYGSLSSKGDAGIGPKIP